MGSGARSSRAQVLPSAAVARRALERLPLLDARDGDLLRLDDRGLRHRDLEDPVLVGRGDGLAVDAFRQREAPGEAAVEALDALVATFGGRRLVLSLTADGQDAVLDLDLDGDDVGLRGLADVDGRLPAGR